MWVWLVFVTILVLIGVLLRQRWRVTSEWLRMERDLGEAEYAVWRAQKERDAERVQGRLKGFEAAFLFILAAVMLALWFFI